MTRVVCTGRRSGRGELSSLTNRTPRRPRGAPSPAPAHAPSSSAARRPKRGSPPPTHTGHLASWQVSVQVHARGRRRRRACPRPTRPPTAASRCRSRRGTPAARALGLRRGEGRGRQRLRGQRGFGAPSEWVVCRGGRRRRETPHWQECRRRGAPELADAASPQAWVVAATGRVAAAEEAVDTAEVRHPVVAEAAAALLG